MVETNKSRPLPVFDQNHARVFLGPGWGRPYPRTARCVYAQSDDEKALLILVDDGAESLGLAPGDLALVEPGLPVYSGCVVAAVGPESLMFRRYRQGRRRGRPTMGVILTADGNQASVTIPPSVVDSYRFYRVTRVIKPAQHGETRSPR